MIETIVLPLVTGVEHEMDCKVRVKVIEDVVFSAAVMCTSHHFLTLLDVMKKVTYLLACLKLDFVSLCERTDKLFILFSEGMRMLFSQYRFILSHSSQM